ncbi:hypothetical protein Q4610_14945 [Sphingobium sp. HBC34]|uniref:Uncharacterized protein n=1 Tax=Sphingobium cyanobacteriorum TaxID=3063954 RepID=A0ABT8ZP99_9SPHN|nr:hypothetical protein [Sphingobium sp. HBC34]MDO7836345.1 hypothetical protein [Sphingobium sp. HBC34]
MTYGRKVQEAGGDTVKPLAMREHALDTGMTGHRAEKREPLLAALADGSGRTMRKQKAGARDLHPPKRSALWRRKSPGTVQDFTGAE